MNNKTYQLKVGFFIVWILITVISFFLGFFIFFALGYTVEDFVPKLTNTFFGLGVGAVVGYSQWLYLRKQIPVKSFWGLASAIGLGISFIITAMLYEFGVKWAGLDQAPDSVTPQWAYPVIYAVGGFLIGLLQMHLLKSYFRRALFWPIATSIAWGSCAALFFLPIIFGRTAIQKPTHSLLSLFIGGILMGVITGIGLLLIAKTRNHGD